MVSVGIWAPPCSWEPSTPLLIIVCCSKIQRSTRAGGTPGQSAIVFAGPRFIISVCVSPPLAWRGGFFFFLVESERGRGSSSGHGPDGRGGQGCTDRTLHAEASSGESVLSRWTGRNRNESETW